MTIHIIRMNDGVEGEAFTTHTLAQKFVEEEFLPRVERQTQHSGRGNTKFQCVNAEQPHDRWCNDSVTVWIDTVEVKA
jgi:hypothetical protein